eukprot:scaffold26085_cov113-Cylindrotheca_fusiformis.AAC.2
MSMVRTVMKNSMGPYVFTEVNVLTNQREKFLIHSGMWCLRTTDVVFPWWLVKLGDTELGKVGPMNGIGFFLTIAKEVDAPILGHVQKGGHIREETVGADDGVADVGLFE